MQQTYTILRTLEETYTVTGELIATRTFEPITSLKAILESLGETFTESNHNMKYRKILNLIKHKGLTFYEAIAVTLNEEINIGK
ncbi:MAG: hypothetical protein QMC62_14305 [Alteromonadaceae bacterium]